MGLQQFFGFGRGSRHGTPNPGSAKEFLNATLSATQKEAQYLNRFNVFNYIEQVRGAKKNASTIAISDLENFKVSGNFGSMANVYNNYVYTHEISKDQRLMIYREMAKYPEISFAVDEYVNEAVNIDKEGKFMELIIKSTAIRANENMRRTLLAEWDNLIYDIIEADKFILQWFREFMIDGEIGFEKVFDNDNPKDGIKKLKKLKTGSLHPVWDDLEVDKLSAFLYKTRDQLLTFPGEAIAYANSGLFEYTLDEDDKIVLSFLEPAKTTYKRLKQMEDALVIYRLTRAPERRVFNIDVGQMPIARAEKYIEDMMKEYRQKRVFDPKTGESSENVDVMAMTEDFWFPVFNGGKQSKIDTLPGGENLGKMDDVVYFRDKMYKGLKVPIKRFESDTGFSIGDTSDITREEVKFTKQVKAFCQRFSDMFKQIFITHLTLTGVIDEYGITAQDLTVQMFSNNLFDRYFEAKITELKFQRFSGFASLIDTESPMLSKEWVAKNILEFSDTQWDTNVEMLIKEEAAKSDDETSSN